jgi:cystathionine gamma-synthase
MSHQGLSPETLAAQASGERDPASGALVPPIHPSTIYEANPDGTAHAGIAYTRADNPTYDHAERLLAALEGGATCMLFASGSAAATAVFQSLLPGDHVLVSRILYWGIRRWLAEFGIAWGLDVEFVDTSDVAAVRRAMRPGRTRLLWLETPANPTWDIVDLTAVAEIAHEAGARVAADNTVATPVLTRPIEFGADLVVHSATKYLNGHSDVLAGAVVTARRDPFSERIRSWRRNAGCVPGPFEAWLLQRGMRTLFVRVRHASGTAMRLARHFEGHSALRALLYPGLPSHPGHETAARQMVGGFGGMLSIRLAGGESAALAVLAALKVFKRATSLGGVESLVEHRRSTEGASSPVPEDLLRLSVGLEAAEDLIDDLETALDTARSAQNVVTAPASSCRAPEQEASDITARITAVVEGSVAPAIIARGGSIHVVSVDHGIVTLEAAGSPGAVVPAVARIETMLHRAVPEIRGVKVLWPGETPARSGEGDLADRVRHVLDAEINRAVAAHGGHVTLVDVSEGRVRLRLEGGCQGCSLAEVTLRQGIEPLLRRHLPELLAVVDVTDHSAATAPFFAPGKR